MKNIKVLVSALFIALFTGCLLPAKPTQATAGPKKPVKQQQAPTKKAPSQMQPKGEEQQPLADNHETTEEQPRPPAWCLDLPSNLVCQPDGKGGYMVGKSPAITKPEEPASKPATPTVTPTTQPTTQPVDQSKILATQADIAQLKANDEKLHEIDVKIFNYLKAVQGGWAIGGYNPTRVYGSYYGAVCTNGHMIKVNNMSTWKYRLMYFDLGATRLVSERPLAPTEQAYICLEGDASSFSMRYQDYTEQTFGTGNLTNASQLSKTWPGGGFKPQSNAWKGADVQLPKD